MMIGFKDVRRYDDDLVRKDKTRDKGLEGRLGEVCVDQAGSVQDSKEGR